MLSKKANKRDTALTAAISLASATLPSLAKGCEGKGVIAAQDKTHQTSGLDTSGPDLDVALWAATIAAMS